MIENVTFLDESHDLLEKSDLGGGLLNFPELDEWKSVDSVVWGSDNNWTNIGSIENGLYLVQIDFMFNSVEGRPSPNGHSFEFGIDISGHIARNTIYSTEYIVSANVFSVWSAKGTLPIMMRVVSDVANVNFQYRLLKCKLR